MKLKFKRKLPKLLIIVKCYNTEVLVVRDKEEKIKNIKNTACKKGCSFSKKMIKRNKK